MATKKAGVGSARWTIGTELSGYVVGDVVAKGNMRAFIPKGWNRAVITDGKGKELRAYETAIGNAVRVEMQRRSLLIAREQAFELHLIFFLVRPKGQHNAAGIVKPTAPIAPIGKPDFDKLTRAATDAISKVAIDDDSRVVRAVVEKRYADAKNPVGTWFRVRALATTLDEQQLAIPS